MVQIVEQDDGIFGRLGRSFGQSLAEQAPKEIDRYRLRKGLESLKGQDLTPLELTSKALTLPGMTPENFNAIAPLLQKQSRREGYEKTYGSGDKPKASGGGGRRESAPRREQIEEKAQVIEKTGKGIPQPILSDQEDISISPRGQTNRQLDKVLPPSSQDIDRQTSIEMQNDPYADPYEVRERVQERMNNDYKLALKEQGETQRLEKVEQEFTTDLQNALGRKDISIEDSMKTRLEQEGLRQLNDPRNQKSKKQIINGLQEQARTLSKGIKSVDTLSKEGTFFGRGTKQIRESLNNLQKTFEKANSLDDYQDLLISKFGFSPAVASSIAYPTSKGVREVVESAKPITPQNFSKRSQIEDRAFESVTNRMRKGDSVLAIADSLRDKGYDARSFIDYVSKKYQDGEISLTEVQERELGRGISGQPTLADMWFFKWKDFKRPNR